MRRPTIAIMTMFLTSCGSSSPFGTRNGDVCSDFPPRIVHMPADNTPEISQNAEACVQHWAARLSLGSDRADLVAQAALGACRPGIQDLHSRSNFDERSRQINERRLREMALFRVIQQRAGNCGVPEIGELPAP